MNNRLFIPSNGIGEIYLDVGDMYWYRHNSTKFSHLKEIPSFNLLLDMASLRMRYYAQLNGSRLFVPQTLKDIGHISRYFIKSFITIKSLSKDLFSTGDIEILDYCMEVYRQWENREPFDFFIADKWEIRDALWKIQGELLNFRSYLERLFTLLYSLFPKKSKFRNDLNHTEQLFKKDLIKQFKKFIRTDGKYSSEIFLKERKKYKYFFDGEDYFKVENKF